jgi:phenylacetate-CoA ligase
VTSRAEALSRLMRQLEKTQWQSREELAAVQSLRLGEVAGHCEQHSPQFARRLSAAGITAAELAAPGGLQKIAVLKRRELQTATDIFCETVPKTHQPVAETRTSGSTGEPVVVRRTAVSQMDWLATSLREHLWHNRDFAHAVCVIRATISKPQRAKDWGEPVNLLFESGPLLGLPVTLDIGAQANAIADFKPRFLIVYPNNLGALARHCREKGVRFEGLRQILTMGETLSPDTRALAGETFGADVADMYSSQELGTIALQCPVSPLYHVMAENLIVEVLDEDGALCGEGETGRLVITDLRNLATPLIRYDIGDYGEVGPPCPCGRGLPTLRRILGRERNLILMPDGTRHWPLVGFHKFREIAPVTQYQFIQHTCENIEVRLVTERPLDNGEEDRLRSLMQKALGHAFALQFVYFDDRIPPATSGKFEDFVCLVTQ